MDIDIKTVLDVLSRWVHLGAAITILGGGVFLRFVVMPSASELSDAEHTGFRERLLGRWKRIVGAGIGLLLISGFYNYLAVSAPVHHESSKIYHPLMGVKILLAFGVFFLLSALTGRAKAFEAIRANSRKWLVVTILMASAIVAISGFLKVAVGPDAPPSESEQTSQTTVNHGDEA